MKKALLIGLLASVSTAQAGTLTAKPSFPSYSKPAPSHAPSSPAPAYSSPSSGPTIGKNVPQNNTAAPATPASTHSSAPASPAPAAAPAPAASSGMGGIVGGMAAGALLGAGATMLLSDSGKEAGAATTPAGAAPAGTVAGAPIMPYSGNVEQDFMSGMLLWQNKNYAELINITNPYLACTNCSDKDKFMMELNRLGKLNVGAK